MKNAFVWTLLVAVPCLAACDQGGGSSPKTTAPEATSAPVADQDLAVPADFEDEAEKSISQANYKAELDTLEKEVDAP